MLLQKHHVGGVGSNLRTQEEKDTAVPYKTFMPALVNVHESVLDLCRRQQFANNKSRVVAATAAE